MQILFALVRFRGLLRGSLRGPAPSSIRSNCAHHCSQPEIDMLARPSGAGAFQRSDTIGTPTGYGDLGGKIADSPKRQSQLEDVSAFELLRMFNGATVGSRAIRRSTPCGSNSSSSFLCGRPDLGPSGKIYRILRQNPDGIVLPTFDVGRILISNRL